MNKKQRKMKAVARVLALVVAVAMILMSGVYLFALLGAGNAAVFVYAAEGGETTEQSLQRLDRLRSVIEYIDGNYADDISVEMLTDAAYNGVFDALDAWSVYYKSEEEKDAFMDAVTGQYAGIGVSISLDEQGRCIVVQVNTTGPAYEAGIAKGAVVLRIDGVSIEGMPLDEIGLLMRGEPGTQVTLVVEQDGQEKSFPLVRRELRAQTVDFIMLEDKIGYIVIAQFSGYTYEEFRIAKMTLLAEGMEKMIVDIRGNGGGVLGDALEIASMMVPAGKPLAHFEQQGRILETTVSEGNGYRQVPTVLLIDEGSASASECLAAALKGNAAATLIGTTTYGKGRAQTIVSPRAGENFKLSFCNFLGPNQERIDGVGVTPDIAVFNGAALSQADIAAIEASLLPMEEGRKYFAGQIGLTVLATQQRLLYLGYDVDGNALMDAKTVEALKRIQALYGACPYGGLDFCTIELVQRAFNEFLYGDGTDKQLQKAIEVLQ